MPKYLALYVGAAQTETVPSLTDEESQAFIAAWGQWAQAQEGSINDPGSPLSMKKVVTARGIEDADNTRTGYSFVHADSLDSAAEIFANHPHLGLLSGNSIEVYECPAPPKASASSENGLL